LNILIDRFSRITEGRERSTEEEGGREVVRRWRGRKEGDRY
jgi:hypothetical protein